MILRITKILLVAAAAFSFSCSGSSEAENAPNIILIMADDMGYECLGTYGSLSYKTPRLDLMAKEGVRFDACVSNPLCTPSRVKIMTGKYNYRNYEYFGYLNPNQYTFGNLLNDAGYKTCIVGKWQLNGIYHDLPGNQDLERPHHFGFNEYCLWQVHKGRPEGERFADPLIVQNGKELPRNPDAYGPDVFANYAIDFIDRMKDSTFFIYYPMVLVHEPFVPTPDSDAWSDPGRRYERDTAYFKDMVAYTDKIIGKILDKINEEGIAENTLVIFTGDNGTDRRIVTKTDHRTIRGGKGSTIDAGVHVPLIMQWKGTIAEGRIHDKVVDFTDFFATFSEISGNDKPTDGINFLPLLHDLDKQSREYAFVHYDPMWGKWQNKLRNQFVQNEKYKLYQTGELFDIKNDVDEKKPLLQNHEKATDIRCLNEEILQMYKEMQHILDTVPLMKGLVADP